MLKKNIFIAYIPVIHQGYMDTLKENKITDIYLIDHKTISGFEHLSREIRALTFEQIKNLFIPQGFNVSIFSKKTKFKEKDKIFMADEDISHKVKERYFPKKKVLFVNTFLRWDWSKSSAGATIVPEADVVIKKNSKEWEKAVKFLFKAKKISEKSSCWWRQVGALLKNKGKTLVVFNKHMPSEYTNYIYGDPRDNFKPGEFTDVSTVLHAEKGIISTAAKKGISENFYTRHFIGEFSAKVEGNESSSSCGH